MSLNMISELEHGYEQMVAWRRYMHQHPELSFQEKNTAKFIAEQLSSFHMEVKTEVGGGGVVGYLRGGGEGPTIALRADFDALPIYEENELPYKSCNEGVMHACGHDGHTATLLGVAKALSEFRTQLNGNIVFLFQHAEELPPGGANAMIADSVLDGVDYVYGAHLASDLPLGKIGLRTGATMAAVDRFSITVQGRGGHGARPHETIDALVIGSQLVQALQHVVSRHVSPLAAAVVTVGVFQAGSAFNVIADKAYLEGTVRTFDAEVRSQVEADIRTIVKGICDAGRSGYTLQYDNGYPALVNPAEEIERLRAIIVDTLGSDVCCEKEPSMGGEDFAYYLQHRQGAFFFVGSCNDSEQTAYPHHHPRFDIDERSMLQAGKLFLNIVQHHLG